MLDILRKFRRTKTDNAMMDASLDECNIRIPPLFVVGTGRCGTHFASALLESDPTLVSMHTDSINLAPMDSFVRYCLWYGIEVDLEPMRRARHRSIVAANQTDKSYFEANAYLSSVVSPLHEWFSARFLLLLRNPEAVVNSHFIKGWYQQMPARHNVNHPPAWVPGWPANHFFGRIVPVGEEYRRWEALTRVGRIAWWVNVLNVTTFYDLQELPDDHWRICHVEDINYDVYCKLNAEASGKKPMGRKQFEKLRARRPGKGNGMRLSSDWSARERAEFDSETAPMRELFGY